MEAAAAAAAAAAVMGSCLKVTCNLKNHHLLPTNKVSISSHLRTLSSSSHAQADHHLLIQQQSSNPYPTTTETQTVGVQLQLHRQCSFGHNFLITGDHPILGLWDPNNAIPLTWSDGHIWTAHLDIPVGICIKFKLIMQETNGNLLWQPGPDRLLQCFQTQNIITLCEDWENPHSRIIIETNPTMNQQIQCVDEINMNQVLVSDEAVPVLVPGLTQLPVNEDPEPVNGAPVVVPDTPKVVPAFSQHPVPDHEPEPVNGGVSTEPDMAKDLTLPELDSKGDIANTSISNPRPEISSIQENQESCENKHQEMQVAGEQDHQATQPMISLLHNDVQWSSNLMQKFLNFFGIQ